MAGNPAGSSDTPAAPLTDLIAIMMTATFVGAAMSLGFPLFSLVLEARAVDPWMIGLITAAQGLGVIMVAPLAPLILERLQARRTMQLGVLIASISIIAMAVKIEPLPWFLLRLLLGVGGGLIFIVSEASINALATNHNRGRIIGIYATLFCVGYASGPAVIALAGIEGLLPFVTASSLLALGLIPAAMAKAADRALAGPQPPFFSATLRHAIKVGGLPLFAIFIFGLTEASMFSFLPIFGLDHGLDEKMSALMLTAWIAGNILMQYPIGMLSDRFPRVWVLGGTGLVSVLSLIALPWLIGGGLDLWLLLMLQGSAMGGVYVLSLAILGERFTGSMLAVANTGFIVMLEFGLMIGPALTGVAISAHGAPVLPWLMALFLLILSLTAFGSGWARIRRVALDSSR